jgi:hypothetical protein
VSSTRVYRFLATTIGVGGDAAPALDWIDEFLRPGFEPSAVPTPDFEVRLRTEAGAFESVAATRPAETPAEVPVFALDQRIVHRPWWSVGRNTVVLDEKFEALYVFTTRGIEVIARPGSTRFRAGAMRLVREIASARALAGSHRLQMHCAAICLGGRGVLLAGPKTCGKTTFLCHIARSTAARILTNDRAMLSFSGTDVEVRGMPTIVSVRPGTLALLRDLFRTVPLAPVPAHLTLAEAEAVRGPIDRRALERGLKVSPAQLSRELGVELTASSTLAAVAFPAHHPEPDGVAVERLSPEAAAPRLLDALYGVHSGKTEATIVERWVGGSRPDGADEALVARLAGEIPCFSMSFGAAAYSSAETARRAVTALLEPETLVVE